ncbi:MAG: hypothetical protein Q6K70_09950, partial [Thermostichales cyanobacterium DRC_bins_46]
MVLRVEGVRFAYPGCAPCLRGVRLRVQGGERVGVALEAGGVEAVREAPVPLTLSPPEGEVRPTGTHLRLYREGEG